MLYFDVVFAQIPQSGAHEIMRRPDKTIADLKSGEPLRIVALGDSLTQGWMVRRGYVDFLNAMIKEKFANSRFVLINRGIPGDTAEGGLYRLEYDVLGENPDCVFIQFGLNDAFSGYSPGEYESLVEKIIMGIREATAAEIILVTSSYIGGNRENRIVEEFYGRLENLARKYSLPIAKVHEYWKKRIGEDIEFRKLVQFDSVHPTEMGYLLMAEAIMQLFEEDDEGR